MDNSAAIQYTGMAYYYANKKQKFVEVDFGNGNWVKYFVEGKREAKQLAKTNTWQAYNF